MPACEKFKKDALWKPLMRMFRRFLKKYTLSKASLKQVKETKFTERARVIEQALNLPMELVAQENTKLACMIMLNSYRLVHNKKMNT